MRNTITVDGVNLSTFGVYCNGVGTFGSPFKEYTLYDVPNRDGSVLGVQKRLQNIQVSYECFIYTNFAANMQSLRSFLLSLNGYVEISDTYDTTHFRKGFFEGPIEPEVRPMLDSGKFTLTFNCLPQRWLNSGKTWINSGLDPEILEVDNPTRFIAKPIIKFSSFPSDFSAIVYGDGGDTPSVSISVDTSSYVGVSLFLDSESHKCYDEDGTNVSKYVTIIDGTDPSVLGVDFPQLSSGKTCIEMLTGAVSLIQVLPRWWEV